MGCNAYLVCFIQIIGRCYFLFLFKMNNKLCRLWGKAVDVQNYSYGEYNGL